MKDVDMNTHDIFNKHDTPGEFSYKSMIKNIVNIDFSEEEAALHYRYIMEHQDNLIARLSRDVSLSVAALDYFTFVRPLIKCPKVLEENEYWTMLVENYTDSLTGLFLRRHLPQKLTEEIDKGKKGFYSFSVVFLDIDDFSQINNTYGHLAGDKVLKHVTHVIKSLSRKRDIVFRYGGEEFIIVMPDTKSSEAFRFTERLREKLEKKSVKIDGDIQICATISGGIASYPQDAFKWNDLIEKADCAMYTAKERGKNRIFKFNNVKTTKTIGKK